MSTKRSCKRKLTQAFPSDKIICRIIQFLGVFMPMTLVKRIVSMILIAASVPDARITEMTGLCNRSVRSLKKALLAGDIDDLFVLKCHGSKSKLAGLETQILSEVETNNYHTMQQIADMVDEKFHIRVSVTAIRRLLKKTA